MQSALKDYSHRVFSSHMKEPHKDVVRVLAKFEKELGENLYDENNYPRIVVCDEEMLMWIPNAIEKYFAPGMHIPAKLTPVSRPNCPLKFL